MIFDFSRLLPRNKVRELSKQVRGTARIHFLRVWSQSDPGKLKTGSFSSAYGSTPCSLNSIFEVIFNKVSFSYDETPIIENLSLEIKKGQMIALVGASGSGKTTLTYLINRFYDIDSGVISIDGVPINKIKKKSLYRHIGMVTQESILFNDSILNNLKLGKPDASDLEIKEAAKAANADEFIETLPQGYQTLIGDSGNKLSGGQKQRLTIARALLKDPAILILDEATSSLDTIAEQQVQLALEKLMFNRTSLVIAHRLSTIQKADIIMVLEKGGIIAQGTHKELLKSNKQYKSWVKIQQMD